MLISELDTDFLEVSAHALLKVASETYFKGKKAENLAFLDYFFRSKWRNMTCFFHNFGAFLPCSDTYFLEVSARVFCTQQFCGYW